MAKVSVFESVCCSRCGGSGSYSWNAMSGSRCFKCNGLGWVQTKRGQAAQAYFTEICSLPAKDFKVGDLAFFDFYFWTGFQYLTEVEVLPNGDINLKAIRAKNGESCSFSRKPDELVRKGWSGPDKEAKKQEALAFQSTLTKAGVPSKKLMKEVA